jgi:hypothetical protein
MFFTKFWTIMQNMKSYHLWNNNITFFPLNEKECFCIFIDYRGHHKKVLQFIIPLKLIYNKNLISLNKNAFLSTTEWFKQKEYINSHYFCHGNLFQKTFSELPPMNVSTKQRWIIPLMIRQNNLECLSQPRNISLMSLNELPSIYSHNILWSFKT